MNISEDEQKDLFAILTVAYGDAAAMQAQSHDHEEIEAYEEQKRSIQEWVLRLQKEASK